MPHISPFAVDLLEAPDLISDPAVVDAFSDALDELAIALDKPASLEEVLLNLIKSDEPGSTPDGAEEPVRVLAVVEIEAAVLVSARQARGRLGDVDVCENVGGCVGGLGRGVVLVDVDGDGSQANCLTSEISDAL